MEGQVLRSCLGLLPSDGSHAGLDSPWPAQETDCTCMKKEGPGGLWCSQSQTTHHPHGPLPLLLLYEHLLAPPEAT